MVAHIAREALRGLRLSVLAIVLASSSAACSDPSPQPMGPTAGSLNILFVGNSLTYFNNMPDMVRALLEEADVSAVFVASVSIGGYGLQDHWVTPGTHDAIASANWDYVVLQQGPSATEGRPSLLDYTLRFDPEIRAVGARPAHYMVWPASERNFDFDGVVESYAMAAASVGGLLFPAGEAWRAVWRRDSGAALYGPDGFHPSVVGSYVAALTIADRLVGAALRPSHVVRTSSGDVVIDPAYGDMLLAAAREANAQYP